MGAEDNTLDAVEPRDTAPLPRLTTSAARRIAARHRAAVFVHDLGLWFFAILLVPFASVILAKFRLVEFPGLLALDWWLVALASAAIALALASIPAAFAAARRAWSPARAAREADRVLATKDTLAAAIELSVTHRADERDFVAATIRRAESLSTSVEAARIVQTRFGWAWTAAPITLIAIVLAHHFIPQRPDVARLQAQRAAVANEEARRELAGLTQPAPTQAAAQPADAKPEPTPEEQAASAAIREIEAELASGKIDAHDARTKAAETLTQNSAALENKARVEQRTIDDARRALARATRLSRENRQNPDSRSFREALSRPDLEAAARALDELAKSLDAASPEDREAAAQELESIADTLDQQPEPTDADRRLLDAARTAARDLREPPTQQPPTSPEREQSSPPPSTSPERERAGQPQPTNPERPRDNQPTPAQPPAPTTPQPQQPPQSQPQTPPSNPNQQPQPQPPSANQPQSQPQDQRQNQNQNPPPSSSSPQNQQPNPPTQPQGQQQPSPQSPQQSPPQNPQGQPQQQPGQQGQPQGQQQGQQQGQPQGQQPGQPQGQPQGQQPSPQQNSQQPQPTGEPNQPTPQPGTQPSPSPQSSPQPSQQPGNQQPRDGAGPQPTPQPSPQQTPQQAPGTQPTPQPTPQSTPQSSNPQPNQPNQPGQPSPQAAPGAPRPQSQPQSQPGDATQQSTGERPASAPGSDGTRPDQPSSGPRRLSEALRELDDRSKDAAQQLETAKGMKDRAEELLRNASPEERAKLEELAKRLQQSQRPVEEWRGPTQTFDTRPRDLSPSERATPPTQRTIAEWLSAPKPGGTSTSGAIAEPIRRAQESANNAIERQEISPQHADLVRRVFRRYNDAAAAQPPGQPTPQPAPQPAPVTPPRSEERR